MDIQAGKKRNRRIFAVVIILIMSLSTMAEVSAAEITSTEAQAGTETQAKKEVQLEPVKNVKILRYSTTSLKIQWNAHVKAKYYRVYRSASKKGTYKQIAVTKKTHYRDKKLKKNKQYYYRVKACAEKRASVKDSDFSSAVGMKTKSYTRITVLAGDSVMSGMTAYKATKYMDAGGKKKVLAKVGLGTLTFQTKNAFGGKTGMEKLLSCKPYRVYIMLGMNEVHWRPHGSIIADYRGMIKEIKAECPNSDIVLLPVSPVTKGAVTRDKGFKKINALNKKIKALAKKCEVKYYDYTAAFKNSKGYLKDEYNGGDGIHWRSSGYKKFAKLLAKYDKQQD